MIIIELTFAAIPPSAGSLESLLDMLKAVWIVLQQLYLASMPEQKKFMYNISLKKIITESGFQYQKE